MWLLLLEALLAMMILVFIVWWTMFSGQKPVALRPAKPALPPDEPRGS